MKRLDRQQDFGAFGKVTGDRRKPLYASRAKTLAKRIDEGCASFHPVGVAFASLSLFMNLVYLPFFPVWSIVVIAIDAFVIWALLTPRHGYR